MESLTPDERLTILKLFVFASAPSDSLDEDTARAHAAWRTPLLGLINNGSLRLEEEHLAAYLAAPSPSNVSAVVMAVGGSMRPEGAFPRA